MRGLVCDISRVLGKSTIASASWQEFGSQKAFGDSGCRAGRCCTPLTQLHFQHLVEALHTEMAKPYFKQPCLASTMTPGREISPGPNAEPRKNGLNPESNLSAFWFFELTGRRIRRSSLGDWFWTFRWKKMAAGPPIELARGDDYRGLNTELGSS